MNIKVFIASHKLYPNVEKYIDDSYQFIQTGKHGKPEIPNFLSDDGKDLISEKNPNYSELTALYYIWKKTSYDVVGLIHYRRLFSNKRFSIFSYQGLKKEKIETILSSYDAILPLRPRLRVNMRTNYQRNHFIKDLDLTREIVSNMFPDYLESFDQFLNSNRPYLYNMFIMKKELLNQYCEFLFPILFELEKQVDLKAYDDYQKRLFGFISERLFNVWVLKENIKVKEVPVIEIERKPYIEFIKGIARKIFGANGDVKR
ncbi:DUF4422 domain-containing protein [Acholeplasma equirhinis]|uniref:DUF4422 domain-containing protein n=1 Tax=Acholeplasma equirhinis TaxID=555393 RepID=UPI00197AB37D|nr:DUF4422 domain-containing protein [Acholeplasma equirhinis]MBN3489996.1 DUF4422 domain-containing protein [Acholeplasma equirhinis]